MPAPSCLVLMFKAPLRSKRRLHAEIGGRAVGLAERLLDCALEDLAAWPGPVCYAAAARADGVWLRTRIPTAGAIVEQRSGNLGARIMHVNSRLLELGHRAQIFIGSDCPALGPAYLAAADRALQRDSVVLGPAADGGVVLLGTCGAWPDLEPLPWSTPSLGRSLIERCEREGRSVALLEPRADVDSSADLAGIETAIAADARPARRALLHWLQSAGAAQ